MIQGGEPSSVQCNTVWVDRLGAEVEWAQCTWLRAGALLAVQTLWIAPELQTNAGLPQTGGRPCRPAGFGLCQTRAAASHSNPSAAPSLCNVDLHDAALVQLLAVRRHPAEEDVVLCEQGRPAAGERWSRSNYGGRRRGRQRLCPTLSRTHHTAARAVFLPSRSWLQNMVALPPGLQAPPGCPAAQEGQREEQWA